MAQYWVVGGAYETTNFQVIADGGEEARIGPFSSYDAARVAWAELAMRTIDDAHVRYRIEREDASSFWVIGGVYEDTRFKKIAAGHKKEQYGPFRTEAEALKVWREKSWEHVDNAFAQYRVEQLDEPEED